MGRGWGVSGKLHWAQKRNFHPTDWGGARIGAILLTSQMVLGQDLKWVWPHVVCVIMLTLFPQTAYKTPRDPVLSWVRLVNKNGSSQLLEGIEVDGFLITGLEGCR